MMDGITYLDNNATTRIDARVLEAMMPLLTEQYGNASSVHRFGAGVAAEVEAAREEVARLIGARPSEIVFTSGGTEADNAALRGVAAARPNKRHIVVSSVEHHAVLDSAALLEREGFRVTRLAVGRDGRLDLESVAGALDDNTLLISVMLANNETGVVYPIREIAELAHRHGVLVHTDAVNALGKMAVDVEQLDVDLLSLSAHKIYGPKGCGALYMRTGTPFRPLIVGGGQESRRRGGTHNAAGIVGLGAACRLIREEWRHCMAEVSKLQRHLEEELTQRFEFARIIGAESPRTANTTCVCFAGCTAQAILLLLSEADICVSSGSACASGSLEPSHVLSAMGIEPEVAQGQIRISTGRFSTSDDIERLLEALPAVFERVRALG